MPLRGRGKKGTDRSRSFSGVTLEGSPASERPGGQHPVLGWVVLP